MLKLSIAAIIVAAVAANIDSKWRIYKETHKKTYAVEMEQIRKFIWKTNMNTIEAHNEKYEKGLSSYYMGENEFTDLTHSEFVARMNGMKVEVKYNSNKAFRLDSSLPGSVDWSLKGYVTEVKNQGQCGSCWAFSTTGSLEGQHFKATGKLVSLSESNLIDCSTSFGNQGCQGGLMDDAFTYIINNNGIDTEASYPYKPKNRKCNFTKSDVGATLSSFKDIETGSESDLQKATATIGPISVAIDASHNSFHLYSGGVYDEPNCSSTQLDHGVLVVGYGTEASKDYWLVKNSWGPSWGMKGYIMMSRNKDNQCGIASKASYPIV